MTKTILLVDDDPYFLQTLFRTLKRERYELFKASDVQMALRILESYRIDLVISDYNMPGVKGVDFLRSIKESHPHIIRIMITGEGDTDVAIRAISDGELFQYLTKPLRPKELISTVRDAFRSSAENPSEGAEVESRAMESGKVGELEKIYPGISQIRRAEDGSIDLCEDEESDAEQAGEEAAISEIP